MITDTTQRNARKLQILECEAWFQVTETIAKQHGLWVEQESRIEKSARVKLPKTGKPLGRVWISYTGIISYELASKSAWTTYVAPTLNEALSAIAQSVEF